jgi:hypothetical protein
MLQEIKIQQLYLLRTPNWWIFSFNLEFRAGNQKPPSSPLEMAMAEMNKLLDYFVPANIKS